MLIWDKQAVKEKKEISEKGKMLARHFNPLRIPKELKDIYKEIVRKTGLRSPLTKLEAISRSIGAYTEYDYDHEVLGERNALQTAMDEKGECIEKFCLLTAICDASVPELARKKGILIAKNPQKYDCRDIDEPGFHAFLTFNHRGTKYIVDDCYGVRPKNPADEGWNAETSLTRREFTAHWLTYTAEDLALRHKKHEEALQALTYAKEISPNDYTILTQAGDVFEDMWELDKAERMYKKAIKMAPGIADPHIVYGTFLHDAYESPEFAIKEFGKATRLPTKDSNLLEILDYQAYKIGDNKLQKLVDARLEHK